MGQDGEGLMLTGNRATILSKKQQQFITPVRDIGFGWVWYGLILHYGINDMTIVAALIQI